MKCMDRVVSPGAAGNHMLLKFRMTASIMGLRCYWYGVLSYGFHQDHKDIQVP
jgi:hypothetical protein